MEDNPFAPPSASAHAPQGRGLVFSEEGVRVVSSLASWMRGLSIICYLAVALVAVGTCALVVTDGPGATKLGIVIAFLVFLLFLSAAATWLRSAADGFERGVMSDDEAPLGQGFRSLRAYLIFMGIISILSLLSDLNDLGKVL